MFLKVLQPQRTGTDHTMSRDRLRRGQNHCRYKVQINQQYTEQDVLSPIEHKQ